MGIHEDHSQGTWLDRGIGTVTDALGFDGEARPSGAKSGWALENGPATRDRSAEFADIAEAASRGENTLPEDAKDYAYLNVGGLFTERYPGYMDQNNERMSKLGLQSSQVPLDTDAGVEKNAATLRDAILAASEGGKKKVVLTGHSKGGVDITAALGRYPELQEHVHAVAVMQSPYGGTPIASDIQGHPGWSGAIGGAIETAFEGDPKALTDLSYEARQAELAAHPYPTNVPTVSLATTSDSALSLVAPSQGYLDHRYGLASDGLVPEKDAMIPGSDVVRIEGMDHASPVMEGIPGTAPYAPGDVQQAMITLALRKAADAKAARPGGAARP